MSFLVLPKIFFIFFASLALLGILVPLLGVGVSTEAWSGYFFEYYEKFAGNVEDIILGIPAVTYTAKWDSIGNITANIRVIIWNTLHWVFKGMHIFLLFLNFIFVKLPTSIGKFFAKFATLRSLLTTRPLDEVEVDRVVAPKVEDEAAE